MWLLLWLQGAGSGLAGMADQRPNLLGTPVRSWFSRLRQRVHCLTMAGTCPFCQEWKHTSAMAEYQAPGAPGTDGS